MKEQGTQGDGLCKPSPDIDGPACFAELVIDRSNELRRPSIGHFCAVRELDYALTNLHCDYGLLPESLGHRPLSRKSALS